MSDKLLSEKEALKQLTSLFGDDSISHPNVNSSVEVISTGSMSLDYSIGVGGLPRGRVIQFAGKESSGKTFLALQTAANWQKEHPDNCFAFLDAEFTYDASWAERFGIDNDRVFYVKSNQAEKLFSGLVGKVKVNSVTKKEKKIAGLFDMIEAGQKVTVPGPEGRLNTLDLSRMGLIILDSIAAMQPPAERTSDVGKQNMALMARFLSVELRKITPGVASANVAMILINQLRVDPGKMFGNPEDSPGGRALKHACSLMINFAPMSGADNTLTDSDGDKIGHRVRAKIGKNKVGSPYRKAEYFIEYLSGIAHPEQEVLEIGEKVGLIERPSSRSYEVFGERFTSRKDMLDFIKSNYEKFNVSIRSMMASGEINNTEEIDIEIEENPFDLD